MPTAAIILAAGRGVRFGEEKQFKLLEKKPLIFHTLVPFLQSKEIKEIILVVSQDRLGMIKKTISPLCENKIVKVVSGGMNRQDSVDKGLKAVSRSRNLVCIHDGVRPFVSTELIESTIQACEKFDGAVTAIKATDTVKLVSNNMVKKTLDRDEIWLTQTPQTFKKQELSRALFSAQRKNMSWTDEAMIMEQMGYSIAVIEGSIQNIKITSKEDWIHAKAIFNLSYSAENS